jgi:hypothetical protein
VAIPGTIAHHGLAPSTDSAPTTSSKFDSIGTTMAWARATCVFSTTRSAGGADFFFLAQRVERRMGKVFLPSVSSAGGGRAFPVRPAAGALAGSGSARGRILARRRRPRSRSSAAALVVRATKRLPGPDLCSFRWRFYRWNLRFVPRAWPAAGTCFSLCTCVSLNPRSGTIYSWRFDQRPGLLGVGPVRQPHAGRNQIMDPALFRHRRI